MGDGLVSIIVVGYLSSVLIFHWIKMKAENISAQLVVEGGTNYVQ